MRTTLTVEDDVSEKLQAKLKQTTGKTFKEIVNETLRLGLMAEKNSTNIKKFEVRSRSLGIKKGLNYDNVGEMIEQIEGVKR